ncbi:Sulfide-quinone reductase [Methylophaga frappieri]|uniref:Sulfide-quinone reductase n=1 Tax=Methylophaga frappieri (strain ATCC BAA-2434 / DSM 25690 / JAM7) TaxID=754477 RepID=I1YHA1_METFJ|nr:FAD/NAD(P)-binding oxidoreductase [Methylophaga frappieri]AFJ02294.1 Sulfide-quinone reductase [Methylophaga frappieri]
MAHIIIIGASTGGLPAAYELRSRLGSQHQITVVSNTPNFHFVPSNPWVALGWRKPADIQFALAPVLATKKIGFYDCGVNRIYATRNQLDLSDGSTLDYDYLIVATGAALDFEAIPGFGPARYSHSVCTVDHAETTYKNWQTFLADPGPVVIGAVQGASCFGPAYEYVMMVNHALRKAGLRDKVPMTFVTSEPYIGHLGLGGVGDSKALFESEFRANDIDWLDNSRIINLSTDKVMVEQLDQQAKIQRRVTLPSKFTMLIPAFRGVACVAALGAPAVNSRGFLRVDACQRSLAFSNVFGVGVCIDIPAVNGTALPVGVPKTGFMIETMTKAAVNNIIAEIASQPASYEASWNAVCLADIGHTGAAFIAVPQIPPRNRVWVKKGRWVRSIKILFEKYFLFCMRRGITTTKIDRVLLRFFGLEKLK